MKPQERANIIVGRIIKSREHHNPFPDADFVFVKKQIMESVLNDWADTLREACTSVEQRALIDSYIVAIRAATDLSLDQEKRVETGRKALLPHFVGRK